MGGDVNASVQTILEAIPKGSRDNTVLTFCFVDPFNLGDISLSTVCSLSEARFMDFLILVATDMDANRNEAKYTAADNTALTRFLGADDWREEWAVARRRGAKFNLFVLDQVTKRMSAAGYLKPQVDESVLVRNTAKKAPLYRLAFYSKHELGRQFWRETRRYSTLQTNLFG